MDQAKPLPALSELESALRTAEAERLRYRAWPGVLKRAFARERREELVRELRFLHIVGAVAAFCSLAIDAIAIPDHVMTGLVLRIGLLGPLALTAIVLARRLCIGQNKVLVVAAPTTFACTAIFLSSLAEPATATRYLMATLMLFAALMLTLPFRPRELIATALGYSAATLLTLAASYGVMTPGLIEHALLTLMIAGATYQISLRNFELKASAFLAGLSLRTAHAQLEQNNAVLRELSEIDALTGLPNRRWFRKSFRDLIKRTQGDGQVTILMLDIDHFKRFNDMNGHPAGDRALRLVGRALEAGFERRDGIIARFGGEEFVGAIRCQTIGEAERFAEDVRAEIGALVVPMRGGEARRVTCSIGLASTASGAEIDMGHLIARADRALYRAKRDGRDRVVVSERIELRVDRLVE